MLRPNTTPCMVAYIRTTTTGDTTMHNPENLLANPYTDATPITAEIGEVRKGDHITPTINNPLRKGVVATLNLRTGRGIEVTFEGRSGSYWFAGTEIVTIHRTGPTAHFIVGDEYAHDYTIPGLDVGPFTDVGVLDEIAEDWVAFRPWGSDTLRVFGNHPHAYGPLSALRTA